MSSECIELSFTKIKSRPTASVKRQTSYGDILSYPPRIFYLPSNVREFDHCGSGGLVVWASITLDIWPHTTLCLCKRHLTSVRYNDKVLEPYVSLFIGSVDPDFILIDDNARHIELIW
ncbi:transposable element Tcb2 transposase [Trichonephila clavipes]|nr:transposable element Tcb2 transposase [Trichonephila clavipes]